MAFGGRVARWIAAAALFAHASPALTQTPTQTPPTDYEVKAAFLLHFTRLVDWPPGTATGPMRVGVLDNEPFADVLEEVASAEAPQRSIQILRSDSLDRLRPRPHVVFIGTESAAEARRICAALGTMPVLTVGDVPGFAEHGGMIGFRVTDEGRVTFDVNLTRIRAAGLDVSSQLLKIARVIEEER